MFVWQTREPLKSVELDYLDDAEDEAPGTRQGLCSIVNLSLRSSIHVCVAFRLQLASPRCSSARTRCHWKHAWLRSARSNPNRRRCASGTWSPVPSARCLVRSGNRLAAALNAAATGTVEMHMAIVTAWQSAYERVCCGSQRICC